ncbi:MAG: hypothetical protein CTY19_05290 [Methylomonas sp.]|nr:MAG: hypothetical protein CTY19_05290 [Methylomonas sp.]
MKILVSVLSLLLASSSASAALQFSFDGYFGESPAAPPSLGIIVDDRADMAGSSFAGQFTFNATNPDQTGYKPTAMPGMLPLDNATTYFFAFNQNKSASVSINGDQPLLSSAPIEVKIADNSEQFMSGPIYDQSGNVIGGTYSTASGIVSSSIYDVVSIETMQSTPSSRPFSWPPGFEPLLGDNVIPEHVDTLAFTVSALFAPDTFSLDGVNAPNPQAILNSAQPLYLVFQFDLFDTTNERFLNGAGLLENYSLTEVPLPGTLWLFGSVLLGWQINRRKSV